MGRLKLYEILEKLGNRVLYYDTDSCVFISREGEYEPSLGPYLGELTSELESYGPEAYIYKFISGGPKFYGYQVMKADGSLDSVCKVKGLRLNFRNSQKVNFESIEKLIAHSLDNENDKNDTSREEYDECNYKIKLKFRSIKRTNDNDVISVDETKTCCTVLRKRRFLTHEYSLPFGYRNNIV